jgi:hypothetical protein
VTRLLRAVVAAAGIGLVAVTFVPQLGAHRAVHANGVPTEVNLSYIALSNWGPQDAVGTAELIFSEGIVRISATGLTRLTNQLYQGWLVNSESGDAISFGEFNAAADGAVSYQGGLPPIADFGFDLMILTVEPDPDDAPQASQDRSIGGYFSLIGQAAVDGTNDTGVLGTAPGTLPNTGDPTLTTDLTRTGLLVGAMVLSVFVGTRLARRVS